MSKKTIDLLIVGIGPAGITAALYGKRLGLTTLACGDIPGGNLYMIEALHNFPGLMEGIPGTELGIKIYQQAQSERFPSTVFFRQSAGSPTTILLMSTLK